MPSWFSFQLLKLLFKLPVFQGFFWVFFSIIFSNLAVLSSLVSIRVSQQLQMENFEVSF